MPGRSAESGKRPAKKKRAAEKNFSVPCVFFVVRQCAEAEKASPAPFFGKLAGLLRRACPRVRAGTAESWGNDVSSFGGAAWGGQDAFRMGRGRAAACRATVRPGEGRAHWRGGSSSAEQYKKPLRRAGGGEELLCSASRQQKKAAARRARIFQSVLPLKK